MKKWPLQSIALLAPTKLKSSYTCKCPVSRLHSVLKNLLQEYALRMLQTLHHKGMVLPPDFAGR